MIGWQIVKVALIAMGRNKLRSALTMLGVIIGVASVIALVSIGDGARQRIIRSFESLGVNVIQIDSRHPLAHLTVEDAAELRERVGSLLLAMPSTMSGGIVRWRNYQVSTQWMGVTEAFPALRDHPVAGGRFFGRLDVETRRPVAVVGAKVAQDLFQGSDPVGQTIYLRGEPFLVVGVMTPRGEGMGFNVDRAVLLPVTGAQRLSGTNRIATLWVKVRSREETRVAADQITRIFAARYGRPEFVSVRSLDDALEMAGQATRTMTLMLGGIAGVSLLVGGIGIMNIMLVSVSERTREIGIRKAVGARRSHIVLQFLVESLLLSVAGGALGVALGIGGAHLIGRLGPPTAITTGAVAMALAAAMAAGLVFGLYPAIRASRLQPVEALRQG